MTRDTDGYLACRGQAFDATTYTDLVDFLGTNVVPDLRDLMLRGQSDTGAPGAVAGVAGDEVTLAVGNLPSHTHGNGTLTAASAGAHTHEVGYSTGDGGNSNYKRTGVASGTFGYNRAGINSDGAHTHNVTGTTGATGSGNAFSVLNRNQPVHFIIKT